jgi:monofunctional biosynthetic peptidoglycan transglycosylase
MAQVSLVRWVTPRLTLTMVGVAWSTGQPPDQRLVSAEEVSPHLFRALVASEDGWFWQHPGVDPTALCEALTDGSGRGASTLTQQVARNAFLWQGWTRADRAARKALEFWYTAWVHLLIPKPRQLELYANLAQTGPTQFGFEAGAQRAFRRSAARLDRDQAGRLVGLLPAPAHRSPNGSSATARAAFIRQNLVPFPGEPGFEGMEARWARRPGLARCWR